MTSTPRVITFELKEDTAALLINSLTDEASLLRSQADEMAATGDEMYAAELRSTAIHAMTLVAQVTAAIEEDHNLAVHSDV